MSLLLDALRRAAAAKQGPAGDRYTVPRRGDTVPAPAAAGDRDEDRREAPSGGDEAVDLELELREDADDEAQGSRDGGDAVAGTGARADAGNAAAARAVLHAGARRGGERMRAVVAIGAGILVLGSAFAAGTWYYYRLVYADVTRELSSFRPESQPRPVAAAEAPDGSEPAMAPSADAGAGTGAPRPGARAADDEAGAADSGAGAGDATAVVAGEVTSAPDAAATGASGTERGGDDAPAATGDEEKTAAGDKEQKAAARDAAEGTGEDTGTEQAEAADAPTSASDRSARAAAEEEATPARTTARASGGTAQPRRAEPMVQASTERPLADALQAGYEALQAGDLAAAADAYRRARRVAPDNRDALLGAAAVAHRRGEPTEARALYQRILRDHPRDPYARAGLVSLDGGGDPRRSESELKMLLRERPEAASLHFALGNLYAAESRWADAQEAYFEAVRAAPGDPAYAYNLAVALDHLGQRDAARRYYERCVELADGRAAGLPLEAVERRLRQLR